VVDSPLEPTPTRCVATQEIGAIAMKATFHPMTAASGGQNAAGWFRRGRSSNSARPTSRNGRPMLNIARNPKAMSPKVVIQ
jgi:hypothetical protein